MVVPFCEVRQTKVQQPRTCGPSFHPLVASPISTWKAKYTSNNSGTLTITTLNSSGTLECWRETRDDAVKMMGSEMSTPKDELPLAQLLARNKGRPLDPSRKIDEVDGKAKDQTNLSKEENVAKSAPKNYAMARASRRVEDDDKDNSDDSDGDGQDDDEEEESETESDEESEEEEQEDEDEEKDSKVLSSTKAIMLGQSAFDDEDELPLAQILANKKSNLKQKSHVTEGGEENDLDKEQREESSHDERKAKADVTNAESDDDNDDDEPLNDPDVIEASDTEESVPIDQEDEDDESNDADDSLTDDSTTSNKRKRQKVRTSGRKKRKTSETDRGDGKPVRPRAGPRGPIDGRTCPHCNKVFSLNYGLRYHIGGSFVSNGTENL